MVRIRQCAFLATVLLGMAGVGWGQNTATTAAAGSAPAPATTPATASAPATGAASQPGLPAGHPPIGEMMGGAAGTRGMMGGASTAARLSGTLNITVIPGSANPTSTGHEAVTVTLLREEMPLLTMELKTDEGGKLTIPDIPLMPPVQVVVAIHHAGLLQQAEVPPLTPDTPERSLTLKVFDTTEEKPAWAVAMRHVFIEYAPDRKSASVMEMMQVDNPTDRVWLGTKAAGGLIGVAEKKTTLTLTLPAEAGDVEWSGAFDEKDTQKEGGKLVTGSPLFPGTSEFRVSYTLPVKGGAVELPITAPAAVGTLIVIVPADGTSVTGPGLEGGEKMDMGNGQGSVRMFRATKLAAGTTMTVAIRGLGGGNLRNVLIGGAFLLVLVGVGVGLMRKPKAKTKKG
jgi:hypothetical protein